MTDVKIQKRNEVYLSVDCEPHIKYELSEYFSFDVPGAKFMPQYKKRIWDGKIKLFSPANGQIYCGLYGYLTEWLSIRGYTFEDVHNEYYGLPNEKNKTITPGEIFDYVKTLKIPFKVRDYQLSAIYKALRYNRKLLLSPTASGKSLMIYCIVRWFYDQGSNILIVVPTTSLVEQLVGDFTEYGWQPDDKCHKIYAGKDKNSSKKITITTWQSIYKMPKKWFEKYDCVIGDEAHQFKAKSLVQIMTKLHNCKHRIGFTGTLDGSGVNQLVLEGLFGTVDKVIKTNELIDKGYLSTLKINVLLLQHNPIKFETYNDELEHICLCDKRNKFIKNLVQDLEGNTLVLFSRVATHGEPLFQLINSSVPIDRKVFFIYGGVDTEEREEVRAITETEDNAIIVASYGTFSTGINIKNLHNVVFASPSKSRVRNLQSIGRVLRKGNNKTNAVLYDIADDFTIGDRKNYTLNHLVERIKIYSQEKFNYEIIPVNFRKE
jgi:superfamily II DNA or RNA helicase